MTHCGHADHIAAFHRSLDLMDTRTVFQNLIFRVKTTPGLGDSLLGGRCQNQAFYRAALQQLIAGGNALIGYLPGSIGHHAQNHMRYITVNIDDRDTLGIQVIPIYPHGFLWLIRG